MYLSLLLSICLFIGNADFCKSLYNNTQKTITLNTNNVLLLKGEINEKLATQFVYELNQRQSKKGMYVYLDTNGGSVDAGNKIVDEIQKYGLDCIAHKAISMGFVILQSCKNRYITPMGTLMQHQMSYGIADEKAKVESYVDFIKQIGDYLITMQANKIGITPIQMRDKTYNDWWLFGENAVVANCADELAIVKCSSKLTNQTYTVEAGSYTHYYSKCPLVSGPVDKKKNKGGASLEDYLFFA
tara:strand:+ start:438 stop:1166 length:729 start_codon:yes stop_codon:yes gene_type:complete